MKRVLMVVVLVVVAASLGVFQRSRSERQRNLSAGESEEQREEIRQTYQLAPGARVEISGINGAVDVETGDSSEAEVYVLRTANSQTALQGRRVVVEQSGSGLVGLVIRGERGQRSLWSCLWGGGSSKEHVVLKAPVQIALVVKGINGRVHSGTIDGPLQVSGVNGKVEVAQSKGDAEVSGVNGAVVLSLSQMGEKGVRIKGINGAVDLQLREGVNADFQANGTNGQVRSEIPGVNVESDSGHGKVHAKVGSGGAPIALSGINGKVRLARDMGETSTAAAAPDQLQGN
jgi:DUF4097 and DUF4098 domain-containing protein YvlB